MRYTLPFSCVLSACVLLTACNTNNGTMLQPMGMAQTNAQLIEDVIVLDRGEIAAAKLAKKRAVNPQVRHYAASLQDQHMADLNRTLKVSHKTKIKPEGSMTAENLKNHSKQEMAQLESAKNQDFDRNYINAMVTDHQGALQLLDRAIRESTNPMLTKSLQETRKHVAMHLAKAQEIQQKIGR